MTLDLARYGDLAWALLPELVLTGAALLVLLVVAWRHTSATDRRLAGALSLVGLAAAAAAAGWLWWHAARAGGAPAMIAVDDFRLVADALVLGTAALTVLVSFSYLEREALAPEYYVLLLFATLGMMLMIGGEDLMVVFLALELMSVAVYVLAGINRRSAAAAEAALKYFLLGAFASGFLLYGIALVYGATGTTNLTEIGIAIRSGGAVEQTPMLLIGLGLLLVGFGFKVAAVPFHMWAPDVYDGSPTPITGFMATAVKAAAFVALVRALSEAFSGVALWHQIVWGLAVASMVVGNLIALAQRTLKRMLAYSSIAHAGYLLVAVAAGTTLGAAALVFYLVAYTLVTLAAFAILAATGRAGEREVRIDDLAGLAERRPWLAGALAVCMLSLLGFPGTAGFIGKWYILVAATTAGQLGLAVILVLTSVVSAGYYLPVIMAMYMQPAPTEAAAAAHGGIRLGRLAGLAVAVSIVGLLVLGVRPNRLLDLARASALPARAPFAVAAPSGR